MSSADVSNQVRNICNTLHQLEDQSKIQGIPEDYQKIIGDLEKEANDLARQVDHSIKLGEKIAPLNPQLNKELMSLIHALQHSGPFMQVLGSFQKRLLKTFDRIKLVVGRWKPTVTKSEDKPIDK